MTGIRNTGRRKSRRGELDVGKVSEKCRKNVGKEQNDPKDGVDCLFLLNEVEKSISFGYR